jgi:hypothetical protein
VGSDGKVHFGEVPLTPEGVLQGERENRIPDGLGLCEMIEREQRGRADAERQRQELERARPEAE